LPPAVQRSRRSHVMIQRRTRRDRWSEEMPEWLIVAPGVVSGLIILWGALAAFLWVQQRRAGNDVNWRDIARLAPDTVRLIKRLATDPDVPRGTRIWLIA